MELRWLEDFMALARTRHFSRAAEAQNVAQPTLSRRIKLLEDEMGVVLINRNTLPLSLTPAGEIFLASAQEITRIARDTRDQCREIRIREEGRLRFATTQSLYLLFYRSWLMPATERHGVQIDLDLSSTTWSMPDFVAALNQEKCDLVLCYWHPLASGAEFFDSEHFDYLVVCEEELIPVSAVNDRSEPLFTLPGSKKQPLPYISYHPNSFMRPLLDHWLENLEGAPHLSTINENLLSVSVKAMVKEGFGLGWLPRRLVADSLNYGRLASAGDSHWHIPLEVRLYRLKNNQRDTLEPFWRQLEQELATEGLIEV